LDMGRVRPWQSNNSILSILCRLGNWVGLGNRYWPPQWFKRLSFTASSCNLTDNRDCCQGFLFLFANFFFVPEELKIRSSELGSRCVVGGVIKAKPIRFTGQRGRTVIRLGSNHESMLDNFSTRCAARFCFAFWRG